MFQVLATADEENPQSIQAVVAALSPIEEARPARPRAEPAPKPAS